MSKNWASTLRLPRSTLPPRPFPQQREQYIRRCADDFYKWQAENRPASETFTLHDGPPYANGSLHTGHALNKILKDMILRGKVQKGRRVTYIPGWDCHGLPIELKALGSLPSASQNLTPAQIRESARALASRTILEQMRDFRAYGVMGDWDHRYVTMDLAYEVKQLQLFQKMLRRGLVYRKFKPVYWSPSSGTALAEAELEYNEKHVSTSAYIRLPVTGEWRDRVPLQGFDGNLYAVIWTTTPWTLPANRAVAVHDDLEYSIVRVEGDAFIIATGCLEAVREACFQEMESEVLCTVKGDQLRSLQYRNPLQGKGTSSQPIIHGHFVSADSGSGLVHCAPGHGFEDYETCLPLGIPVSAPVDNDGLFTNDAYPDDPTRLEGASVLKEGSKAVLSLLGPDVLAIKKYKHKYPYDWRTKQPIIIRATAQWFADVASIKDHSLEAIENVRFVPESGKKRLEAFIRGRSEWCISRQRAWGVPIPALYNANGDAVMTDESVEHIISTIKERGTDAWWSDDAGDQAWVSPSLRGSGDYTRGTDTMDVWFDSGSSWTQSDGQADVYLEGSDQHRGWFQSSLLTRVAASTVDGLPQNTTQVGLAPFKTLITHGFTLDQKGKKMSKSLGNIISGDQVMDGSLLPPLKTKAKGGNAPPVVRDALGPDALRLWAASSDYTGDVVIGEAVLKAVHQSLLRYRTIIKMLLGSMRASARTAPLTALDHIAVLQLRDVMADVGRLNDNFEFHKALGALNRWVTNDLSAFYLEALKDRLYCADGGGVLEPIFFGFLRMLAPVTPLLVEEAWDHAPEWLKNDPSVHHPLQQLYSDPLIHPARLGRDESQLREAVPVLMATHAAIKAASERARAKKVLGSSLQCSVVLQVPEGKALTALESLANELEAIFVVSSVELNTGPVSETSSEGGWAFSEAFESYGSQCVAWVLPPKQPKCPRCWRYVAPQEDELCHRCEEVVTDL